MNPSNPTGQQAPLDRSEEPSIIAILTEDWVRAELAVLGLAIFALVVALASR